MKNKKHNTFYLNKSPRVKILNPIEECPESEDIIKKLENLNFSSDEKSFDTFLISRSKTKEKIHAQSNKSISIPNLINDNIDDFPLELKSIKEEDISDYDNINNILINKNKKEDLSIEKNNDIHELLLKEKINRICIQLQNYNINQKTYVKINNFIPYISCMSNNLYRPFDSVLDVILELLSKIKEEYAIKEGLINKLNNISLNKEDYEKKIFEIKKELIYKEKEIENLINKKDKNKNELKKNSHQTLLLEINNLKKENQFLFDKVLNNKIQFKQLCSEYKNLHNKYKICLQEIDRINEKNKNYYFKEEDINNFSFSIKSVNKVLNNNINSNSYNKNNDIPFDLNISIKKLTNDLISILFDINKMLFKYDFALVKMNKNNNLKTPLNDIKDLSQNIDINYLLNAHNYKIFSKYFLCNMDIIYNKIINLNKESNIASGLNYYKNKKESKRTSHDKKKLSEKNISLNNSRTNQSINLYVPENKSNFKCFKSYISIKKNREKQNNKKMVKNSTSRNGFTFLNFYSDTDLEKNFIIKKDKNKIDKKFSTTVNLNMSKSIQNYSKYQNGGKSF